MVLINFTNDPKLQPSGDAIDLFEQTLLYDNLYPFCPASYIMWGEWLSGQDESYSKIPYKYKNCEWLVLQNLPVFIVSREFNGKTIYCPALKRNVTVPDNRIMNINIGLGRFLETDTPDYDEDIDEGDYADNDLIDSSYLDVWGCFTVLPNSDKPFTKFEMGGLPAFFIWMDKVVEATDNDEQANMLFAGQMLHSLGHALMHDGMFYSQQEYAWGEEGLANAYTLGKIALTHNMKFYDFCVNVLGRKALYHSLGTKFANSFGLHEIKDLMELWTDIKGRHSTQEFKQRWLDYARSAKTLDFDVLAHYAHQLQNGEA